MFNMARKCDRCGESFEPDHGIYGTRIETIDLYGTYFVNRRGMNVDVYHLCAKCRLEFVGIYNAFIKGQITAVTDSDEFGKYTFTFVEEE